ALDPRQPRPRTDRWIALLAAVDAWREPAFPLLGRDVLDRGIPRGPDVGRLLKAVRQWWEDEDYRPDRPACLKKLKAEAGTEA
ncbi:MAG: CCA tRNA nucleotidyltransferase, partial [Magnetospirillum sp. WYHS-4]